MAVKKMTPKADTSFKYAQAEEAVVPPSPSAAKAPSRAEESLKSILALLRGVGPVLVGSAPNGAEVQKLVDALKDP